MLKRVAWVVDGGLGQMGPLGDPGDANYSGEALRSREAADLTAGQGHAAFGGEA